MGKLRALKRRLFRQGCREHRPKKAHFREHESRFYIELTVCMDCGELLDAAGRRRA